MNKISIAWVVALLGSSALHAQNEPLKRLAVISDVHLRLQLFYKKRARLLMIT